MLLDVWERYRRPILISETGAESDAGVGWLGYISAEVRQAQRLGVEILGICLYPVMDYPGWDDDRHCGCGLIELDAKWEERRIRENLRAELRDQQLLFSLGSDMRSLTPLGGGDLQETTRPPGKPASTSAASRLFAHIRSPS